MQSEDIVVPGGAGWWKIDPVKARRTTHVILTHNAHDRRRAGDPDHHGKSVMIATIRDIVQDEDGVQGEDGRCLVQFDEFAKIDSGVEWPGNRNPVTYVNGDQFRDQLTMGSFAVEGEILR